MARNLLVINVALRETRVALIEDGVIAELQIERARARNTVGNIVLGKVTRVLPGMQAAFIDVGMERAAFLHVEDLIRPDDFEDYLAGAAHALERKTDHESKESGDDNSASDDDDDEELLSDRSTASDQDEDDVDEDDEDDRADDEDASDEDEDEEITDSADDEDDEGVTDSADDEDDVDEDDVDEDDEDDRADDEEDDEDDEDGADDEDDEDVTDSADDEDDVDEDDEDDRLDDQDADSAPDSDEEEEDPATSDDDEEEDEDDADDRLDDQDEDSIAAAAQVDADGDVIRVRRRVAPPGGEDIDDVWPDAEAPTLLAGETLRASTDDGGRDAHRKAANGDEDGNRDGRRRRRRRGRRRKNGGEATNEKKAQQEPRANRTESKQERSRRGRDKRRRGRDADREEKRNDKDAKNRKATSLRVSRSVPITEVVREGDEVIVQISKEPIGTKGARVTSHVSLPGRHVVYLPTVEHIGISKRIGSFRERQRLRKAIESVKPPTGGLIVRTVAEGLTKKHLKEDIGYLLKLWAEVARRRESAKSPEVLYEELDLVLKVARDLFTDEIEKIVIDDKEEYTRLVRFVEMFMPNRVKDVELYSGTDPIFDAYGIEDEIARALSRKVPLPSGGYLILDQAEALTAIDVNTGRYVGKGSKDLEETALKTNLEAVDEIAYQLRFRNIGGLVILDLIDMENAKNRDKVWRALEQRLEKDKAKTTLNRISELGLIEMTRKRTRESLGRTMHEPCFYCDGTGQIMSRTTIAYEILRQVRRELRSLPGYSVHVNAHPAIVDLLKTEEKDAVVEAERRYMRRIEFTPRREYHIEQFDLTGK